MITVCWKFSNTQPTKHCDKLINSRGINMINIGIQQLAPHGMPKNMLYFRKSIEMHWSCYNNTITTSAKLEFGQSVNNFNKCDWACENGIPAQITHV